MDDEIKIFAGNSNPALADAICAACGVHRSGLRFERFSNDNMFVQICENVRERDVFVVQSFTQPVSDHLFELCLTLDALRSASARRITAVIPYYSYARSDKKDAPRISIAGRLVAEILATAGANRVIAMDLHSDQVQGFFNIPVDHLPAVGIMAEHFRHKVDLARAVVVSSDAGGAKRAGKFAERLKLPLAIIDKRRIDDSKVEQGFVVGNVAGRDAIVFDDEIAAASTMVESFHTLNAAGARSVSAVATHGILCGPAVERLGSVPFARIVVTDTVALGPEKRLPNLTVLSVAPLLADTIRCIHTGASVGDLIRDQ